MRGNLDEVVRALVGIAPAPYSVGPFVGASIDTLGYHESLVVLSAGAAGPTAGSAVDVRVQESDDGTTFADITGAAFTQITAANDLSVYVGRVKLGEGRKRYIRVFGVSALGGTDTANHYGVTVLLGRAADLPVSQVKTVEFSV